MQNGGAAQIEAALRAVDLPKTLPLSRLVKLAAEFGLQAELQPAREPAFDTPGDISPIPPDLAEQHTPSTPMRPARASTLSRATETSRRSLGLPLGRAATTIVATPGIAVFLLIPPRR